MHVELTGAESDDQLVKQLVYLRGIARRIVKVRIESREVLAENARLRDRLGTGTPEGARAAVVAAKLQEGANEFFGGVFGEYRERPLMERLVGRAV